MFGLQSLLVHTSHNWALWGRSCQLLFSQERQELLVLRGLTREAVSTRLSKMLLAGGPQCPHQPFQQIGSGYRAVWCSQGVMHTVGTSGPGLCQAQLTQGQYRLLRGHSWNMLVCPNQGLASDQRWQPIMQYFLLLGNCECFVYIILNCTQTMCLPLLR